MKKEKITIKKLGDIQNIAKTVTIWMLIVMSVLGFVGMFLGTMFNMPEYLLLLDMLKDYWLPLVISIGGNSAVSKVVDGVKNGREKKLTSKDEEPVCED